MSLKPSDALRFLGGLGLAIVVLVIVALRVTSCAPAPRPLPPQAPSQPAPHPIPITPPRPLPPPPPPQARATCDQGPAAAAQANAASLDALVWSPFGRRELGWATYAPLIAREIATPCAPTTPGFAAAFAAWQDRQRLPPADGVMNSTAFARLKGVVQTRRAFVRLSAQGICPAPPAANTLAWAETKEGYAGKPIQLRAGALAAYRDMVAAARKEDPRISADPRNLTIFSGYRSPADDAARCAREQNCNGTVRAVCSPHRTGLAADLYVGQAPGYPPDSTADANRLFMSRTPAYRWLVANAPRFGFFPYPFEPWHWEWTGEAP